MSITHTWIVSSEYAGQRLDAFVAGQIPQLSRVRVREAINAAQIKVDDQRRKAAYHLQAGQRVDVNIEREPPSGPEPEAITLDILFEDEHIAFVNKPIGMVVHPAKGHWSGTLASALAYHFQHLSGAGGPTRPGIVHRLDRDTSGVLVIAKTDEAHLHLARQFETRVVEKEYLAITDGIPDRDADFIDQPIGAHPYQREKMAIRAAHPTSRPARTFYQVVERFSRFARLQVIPHTGRTHQIRVHLAHIGCPVTCDPLYSGRAKLLQSDINSAAPPSQIALARPALHAHRLRLQHPIRGEPVECVAPIPHDLEMLLVQLRELSK